MLRSTVKFFCGLLTCCLAAAGIPAQAIRDNADSAAAQGALPPVKISIFSSGLAYYEHSGTLNGPSVIRLPFKTGMVNDALKSLVLNDPASANPFVSYQSEQTLIQTLRSLKIDLSDNPDTASIIGRLRGAEVEIKAPSPVSGRIVGIEHQLRISPSGNEIYEPQLSLYTDRGLQLFPLEKIESLNFKDPQISDDLKRGLDLIVLSRNSDTRDLSVSLPGSGSRRVSLSYVIPAPVWKVSYRLDLSPRERKSGALLQGWAIVDNDSDADWKDVEISLVAGRPASFIQNLYPPYYLSRPVLPLAIAGAAAAATHDSGYAAPSAARARSAPMESLADMNMMKVEAERDNYQEYRFEGVSGGTVETAAGAAAGDQFEFTVKYPVSLDRRMSAMIPLAESIIDARKLLVFSPEGGRHPRLGAELSNTSGMKLPAGPITVYDGSYAGDALIEFWNEDEKRLISYGEDLSVTGMSAALSSQITVSVKISQGVMTISRTVKNVRSYTFKNKSAQKKTLIVEHPKTANTVLESPVADEQTPSVYRFSITLDPEKEAALEVCETRPVMETVRLLQVRPETFVSYASNQQIPQNVRNALEQAIKLRTAVNTATTEVSRAESRRTFLLSEQDRIRKNIEAAGSQSVQGQEYLKRLLSLDSDIDNITAELEKLNEAVQSAQKAYEDYVNKLEL